SSVAQGSRSTCSSRPVELTDGERTMGKLKRARAKRVRRLVRKKASKRTLGTSPISATNCTTCKHGKLSLGHTTITLDRDSTTIVFRGAPASICDNCREEYVDEKTTSALLALAEEAARAGVQVAVRNSELPRRHVPHRRA